MLRTAIIAALNADSQPETEEIRRLTEAAGARVVDELTQVRPKDPGYQFGRGKVEELAERVAETGADTVVVDNELTPQQSVNLEEELGVRVIDRHRVVLEIFAEQARTRRAQLQVELARLRYRLPRVRERSDEGIMNRWTESGTPLYDLRDRIDELDRKLKELPTIDEHVRERRREQGFDLVAIAGYTNAGKSTLLRRLADDMRLDEETHEDLDESAAIEDRLFKTLETTTRRATLDGRAVLLTDTVGYLDDLPHWLVESFRGTLREVEEADAVLLVVDVAESVEEIERKLETALGTIPAEMPVVTALNKADRLDPDAVAERRAAIAESVPNPVVTDALDGSLDELTTAVTDVLPDLANERFELPLSDEAMSFVSWLHDNAVEVDVNYGEQQATASVTARTETIRKARARIEECSR